MRKFPTQYSPELQTILSAMSIGEPYIVGSSADRKILYSADYDMIQTIVPSHQSIRAFVHHVAKLQSLPNTHILDIKIGEIQDWNLLLNTRIEDNSIVNYNRKKELEHLELLRYQKIITEKEYIASKKLLPIHITPIKLIEAKKELRFGILRWTPKEILRGYKILRNNKEITLEEAIKNTGITKVDVISWTNNKYNEFSNIILWKEFSQTPEPIQSLKENILLYLDDKNYFKVLKRIYALSKLLNDTKTEELCISILNSEIGFLYTIVADFEIMEQLRKKTLTKQERQNLKYELGMMTDKIAKVYFPGNKRPKRTSFSLLPKLYTILQEETRKVMIDSSLLPIPHSYLP
jgi:hypothetical protein